MDSNDVLDSLPYYDDDLQKFPFLKVKVDQEFAKEGTFPSQLHPRIPAPVELFTKNTLLKTELERVEANQPIPPLDTIRYQLPGPMSSPGTDEEWQSALDNARIQLEHQKLRLTNLTLLQTYGVNAWKIHNYRLEDAVNKMEKAVEEMRERTVEINRERKNAQEKWGKQLTTLETRWTELISNTLQIEMANIALEAEMERLRIREAELAEMVQE